MSSPNPPSPCRIVYDDEFRSDLRDALQQDTSPVAMQRGFEQLADTLAGLVDRPHEVSLVVAVRLASAVQRRDPSVAYNTDRGVGAVAARTMTRPDGHIEVIIESDFLVDFDDSGLPLSTEAGLPQLSPGGLAQMRKTIIHEAQHAIMHQRHSGFDQFDLENHAGDYLRWNYAVAAKIIDEYRAEWNAAQQDSRQPTQPTDVLDVLEHLGSELAAADARYQAAPTPDAVARLMEEVYLACAVFWTWTAYWVAQFRGNNHEGAIEMESHDLWKRYIGPTWPGLIQILDEVQIEDLGVPAASLRSAAARVASEWVQPSLNQIGFRHVMGPAGEAFYIDRHDFPNRRS